LGLVEGGAELSFAFCKFFANLRDAAVDVGQWWGIAISLFCHCG